MSSTTAEQLCRLFSLADIKSATGDFSEAHVIGKGGFGKVYKGLIDNGSLTVAIKRLAANSNQGVTEFEAEMKTLTKFRHRNLVSLIGYCSEQDEMILVYDYMPNGTLADHLYKSGHSSLSWNDRLKICIGVGKGLDYLHSGCSIIHRDVKSTNILLDENFIAKVSDFGLVKHLSTTICESHVITNVKGSFGYFDPSYFTTGRLTKASDTYAFGVVLLEVLSGRPAIEPRSAEGDLCMTMWAQQKIRNGKAQQIVASNLKGEISQDCLKTFVGVAKRCLDKQPKKRLTMTQAVAQLELALEQQERRWTTTHKLQIWPFWNRVVPSQSGSRQKDENEVVAAIHEEDAFETKQSVDMLPVAAPALQVDDAADMLPVSAPSLQVDAASDMLPVAAPALQVGDAADMLVVYVDALHVDVAADMLPVSAPSLQVDDASDMLPVVAPDLQVNDILPVDATVLQVDDASEMLSVAAPAISLAEINKSTNNFDRRYLIAYGFRGGRVHYGVLKSGKEAAVKKLYEKLPARNFIALVSSTSLLKHENVAELFGYCLDGDLQALVYAYAPRGSLHDILHGQQGTELERGSALSWAQRMKVVVGVARGLCYIHDKGLVHNNIKSSNILLFDYETAKLTDFHLSTERPCTCNPNFGVHPRHLGFSTPHYHPPECKWGDKTQKGDVYSIGMVLLELLTGSKLFDHTRRRGQQHLVSWALPHIRSHEVHKIVDARLGGDYPRKGVARMAALAASCLRYEAEYRPDMRLILLHLESMLDTHS